MQATKLQIKIYAKPGVALGSDECVSIFQAWIREHVLDELMIDVVDYGHVPTGPGVALIGHGSDYFLDRSEGRPGLLFSRKREAPRESGKRLADAFRRAFNACLLLETDASLQGKLAFSTTEVLVRVVDRLRAPSTADGFESLKAELVPFLTDLYGSAPEIARASSKKELLAARVLASTAPDLSTLLTRLGGPIKPS
jgi:hypothetical protein